MLVFGLPLEPVSAIHFLCFVVAPIDEHVVGIEPCSVSVWFTRSKQNEFLTFERERSQDDFNGPGSSIHQIAIHEQEVPFARFPCQRK